MTGHQFSVCNQYTVTIRKKVDTLQETSKDISRMMNMNTLLSFTKKRHTITYQQNQEVNIEIPGS